MIYITRFIKEKYFCFFFNFFSIIFIQFTHSIGKLVMIISLHNTSIFLPKIIIILILKVFFISWFILIIINRLIILHLDFSSKKVKILNILTKYKTLLKIKKEIEKNVNKDKNIDNELLFAIVLKLKTNSHKYREIVNENTLIEYFHLLFQFPIMIKSILSIIIIFTTIHLKKFYIALEIIISILYFFILYLIHKSNWHLAFLQIIVNLWYVLFLIFIFVTTSFLKISSNFNETLFIFFVIKYYTCYFIFFLVHYRHKNSFLISKLEPKNINKNQDEEKNF